MREQSGIHGPKLNNNRPGPKKLRNPDRPYQDQVHFYRTIPDRNQIFQGLSDQFRDSQTRPGRKKNRKPRTGSDQEPFVTNLAPLYNFRRHPEDIKEHNFTFYGTFYGF